MSRLWSDMRVERINILSDFVKFQTKYSSVQNLYKIGKYFVLYFADSYFLSRYYAWFSWTDSWPTAKSTSVRLHQLCGKISGTVLSILPGKPLSFFLKSTNETQILFLLTLPYSDWQIFEFNKICHCEHQSQNYCPPSFCFEIMEIAANLWLIRFLCDIFVEIVLFYLLFLHDLCIKRSLIGCLDYVCGDHILLDVINGWHILHNKLELFFD